MDTPTHHTPRSWHGSWRDGLVQLGPRRGVGAGGYIGDLGLGQARMIVFTVLSCAHDTLQLRELIPGRGIGVDGSGPVAVVI